MSKKIATSFLALVMIVPATLGLGFASAQSPEENPVEKTRTIFVPYPDLKVILDSGPHRVLLSREQYDELIRKAKKTPERHIPHPTVLVSSDYSMTVEDGRARIHGTLLIDVLDDGLHLLPLDLGGVGLLEATLDKQPAAIGRSGDGQLNVLVSGVGQHKLALDMVAPLEMTSAQQVLRFRLANAAVGKWRLTVPGDVEIKGGADVVSRELDKAAKVTRFELLPRGGDTTILMSLNSHFERREQAVASRCVVFDEVTEAYERLHSTMTFWVLHRAVDHFSFYVPDGFEVTEVKSPLLARWDISTENGRKIVNVRLREQTTDTVALSVSAIKTPGQLTKWHMPRLELRDVVSQVTVLGLVVQSDMKTDSLAAENLIGVDTAVLAGALPASLARQEADALSRTFVAAYYAPQAKYELSADFTRPPATLAATTHLLLNIQEQGCNVQGGFVLVPTTEKRFSVDFNVPAGWTVTDVTGLGNVPLSIERFSGEGTSPGRVHVKLPQGVAPGQPYPVDFRASYTPKGWMSEWKSQPLDFPMFSVAGAASDEGALAVAAGEDLEVRPDKLERLVPIVDEEKARFGLANSATALAYRYEARGAKAALVVDRMKPRLTARTFSFFRVLPEKLEVHYEVVYTIDDAKTQRLALLLPANTPEKLTIRGLGDVSVKEYVSEVVGDIRRWNILLGEARRGVIRLAVEFPLPPEALVEPPPAEPKSFPFPSPEKQKTAATPDSTGKTIVAKDFSLPLVRAVNVAYQSGLVAVEGGADLDVQVKADEHARRADVGLLAPADYKPDLRLLGAYSFVYDKPSEPKITIDVVRNPSYALTPAIIERATLKTNLSADGNSQTCVNFQIRTKALYLEVALPKDATLWSAVLDGAGLKPQMKGGVRLLGLPPGAPGASRNLQIVYEAPLADVRNGGRLRLAAPRLLYRASNDAKQSSEIPLVNVQWNVAVPAGYEVVSADGTLEAGRFARPAPAPLVVADVLYRWSGGHAAAGWEAASAESNVVVAKENHFDHERITGDLGAPAKSAHEVMDDVRYKAADGDKDASTPRVFAGPTLERRKDLKSEDKAMSELSKKKADVNGPPGADMPVPATPPITSAASTPPAATFNIVGKGSTPGENTARGPGGTYGALGITQSAPPTSGPGALYSDVVNLNGLQAPPAPNAKPDAAKPAEPSADYTPAPSRGWDGPGPGVKSGKPLYRGGKLLGVNSLNIDIQQAGETLQRHGEAPVDEQIITFTSLGANPEVVISLADRNQLDTLSWAAGVIAFLCGMAITGASVRKKIAFLLFLGLTSALIPLAWDAANVAAICNAVFYAATLLVPYYIAAGFIRWIAKGMTDITNRWTGRAATAAAILTALSLAVSMTVGSRQQAAAQEPTSPPPVAVPEDALIVPYDTKLENGIEKADHLLVPYNRYVELWNRAYPDKKLESYPAPLPYALSGAAYNATLEGDETLNVTGQMQINVLVDDYVSIPLALRGGVLARATLDGKPAQMKIIVVQPEQVAQGKAAMPAARMDTTLFLLQVTGKGPHKLEMEIRLKLARIGGWRGTSGRLPTAPASTVTFHIPQPQTEVRLGLSVDRRSRETTRPDETIETALGADGALQLQWRPKVAEAQVDRGLTVDSTGLLDVEEDGLRMALNLKLEFRRAQRDAFTLTLPAEFLVEKVAGSNVRGWEVKKGDKEQTVEVSLLKTAKDSEQISVFLARSGRVGVAPLDAFTVPCVTVRDAALTSGLVTIRRSVLLDVRTVERTGVTRVDLGALPDLSGGPATEESVLAIRPYEAYRFPTMPFALRLTAAPVAAEVTAEAQTRVKLRADEPAVESKIVFHVGQRKIYRLEVALPDGLRLPEVILPAAGQWTIEKQASRSVLRVNLAQGVVGDMALIVRGKLPEWNAKREMPLPRFDMLSVKRQEGDIAVQSDPAFNVEVRDLRDCQETELERVNAWLDAPLRAATRAALHYSGGAATGLLRLVARTPEIACDTITNVKVTDRDIKETIILNYEIRNAGIREVTFLLPASMRDAQISTPMLRRKTVEPLDAKNTESPLRVRLELQGDAMNDLRVLVANDRLLKEETHVAPLPSFETADGHPADFLRHQYVVLESTNSDELVVDPPKGLDPLSRQQQQWQSLCGLLGTNNLYKAYLVQPGAKAPTLTYHFQRHEELETAGARIDLAQTTMVIDANGAYRAKVEFTLVNSSEQFLDVELPRDSELWTVNMVHRGPNSTLSEPVKPVKGPAALGDRHVLLPVVKTAKGDLSYLVVLKYGGKLSALSAFAKLDFPMVRNVKSYPRGTAIGIERSQLALYVPKSHDWYDFGGTLHAADEAEQKADMVCAFNLEGERLIEAANDRDPYTRLRAGENLKNWAGQAAQVQAENGRVANRALQSQIGENSTKLAQVKDLLAKGDAEKQPQQAEAMADNRDRLNDLYEKQSNVNATGTLVLSGNNTYSGATNVSGGTLTLGNGSTVGAQNEAEFNNKWFDRNNLNGGQLNEAGGQSFVANGQLRGDVTFGNRNAPNAPPNQAGFGANPNSMNYGQFFQQDGLTKGGAGMLTLTGSNNYNGGTTFGGAIQGANPNIGNGSIVLNDRSQMGSAGGISGTGTLTLNGGTLAVGNNGTVNSQQQGGNQQSQSYAYNPGGRGGRGGRAYGNQGDEQQRELAQYQQKLAEGNGAEVMKGSITATFSAKALPGNAAQADAGLGTTTATITAGALAEKSSGATMQWRNRSGEGLADRKGGGGFGGGGGEAAARITGQPGGGALPVAPAGLASLDFELPTDTNLYQVYRFTTPRGEAELTARNICTSAVSRLVSLGIIVAACVLLWFVFALIRRGALGWFRHPLGALLLMLVGVLMLCDLMLPLIAVAAIIAGFWLFVAAIVARVRRNAAAV
jgi:autotransporter-associated beta strand protein